MDSDASDLFHVNLCTYSSLSQHGSAAVSFVEMAFDLADQAGIALRASLEQAGARPSRSGRKVNAKVRSDVRGAMAAGEFLNLYAFVDGPSLGFNLAVRGADVYDTALLRIHDATARQKMLDAQAAHPSPRFLNLAIQGTPRDIQSVVATTCEVFANIEGACGFINNDPLQLASGDQTAYEMARLRFWTSQPDVFKTKLRGAFWGNLLSPTHVELLGGMDRVARDAPCEMVHALDFPDGRRGVYLQANRQQTPELQRYFEPLLP